MNELNEKKYQDIINNLDWNKIHKEMIFSPNGYTLWVYPDGTTAMQTNNTYHNPEAGEYPVLYLSTGIESNDYYLDGWAEYDNYTEIVTTTDDNRELTLQEAIEEAIDCGDWSDLYDAWKEEIKQSIEDDERVQEYEKLQRETNKDYEKFLDAEKLAILMNENPDIPGPKK